MQRRKAPPQRLSLGQGKQKVFDIKSQNIRAITANNHQPRVTRSTTTQVDGIVRNEPRKATLETVELYCAAGFQMCVFTVGWTSAEDYSQQFPKFNKPYQISLLDFSVLTDICSYF
jgi:hypothetical protein